MLRESAIRVVGVRTTLVVASLFSLVACGGSDLGSSDFPDACGQDCVPKPLEAGAPDARSEDAAIDAPAPDASPDASPDAADAGHFDAGDAGPPTGARLLISDAAGKRIDLVTT